MQRCPYCELRGRNSDDHIFSAFLGGTTTIRTCKECNDLFGHSVESAVSTDLAPVVIMLRKLGLVAPKKVIWKNAFRDPVTGQVYDLDSDLGARISNPVVGTDETGKKKGFFFHDEREKKKFIASAVKKGRKFEVVDYDERKVQLPIVEFQVTVGIELRRIAAKTAVATADHLLKGKTIIDAGARRFLLGQENDSVRAIRDVTIYENLERHRPALGHLVYVEGNSRTHSCYGVVQFYGLFQIYLALNESSYVGDDFAVLAILSPTEKYSERFGVVSPQHLARPSQYANFQLGTKVWEGKFTSELRRVFGDTLQAFKLSEQPRSSLWTFSLSTVPFTVFLEPLKKKES